jgi:2-dehydropantoate 2-reductase
VTSQTSLPSQIGPIEYVVVAVKHYHLEQAVPAIQPLVGDQTMVVPLLNGVDAYEYLQEGLETGDVVGGLCSISTLIEAPGVIRQVSQLRRIVVGELDRQPGPRLARLVEAWSECGVEAIHSDDIYAAMWTKFLFIASFGCVSSLTRASAGEILQVPETRALLAKAMQEVYTLAQAQEIHLSSDAIDNSMALMESFEPGTRTSMQRDVEDGRPFELEAFSGKVVQLAHSNGVSVPSYEVMDALLRPVLAASLND